MCGCLYRKLGEALARLGSHLRMCSAGLILWKSPFASMREIGYLQSIGPRR